MASRPASTRGAQASASPIMGAPATPALWQFAQLPAYNSSADFVSSTKLSSKKSAQVLTSAGSGYAYDNSLFTQSFANTLLNNEDDCVSIEDIANRVSKIVKNNSVQNPLDLIKSVLK